VGTGQGITHEAAHERAAADLNQQIKQYDRDVAISQAAYCDKHRPNVGPFLIVSCLWFLLALIGVAFVLDYRQRPPQPKRQSTLGLR
jgi:hypothetical protein